MCDLYHDPPAHPVRRRIHVAAEQVVEALRKQSSQSDLVRVELAPVKSWLSSGSTLLDLALAGKFPGGFPAGRFSHVYGHESTGKTILVSEPLGAAQRQGGIAFFVDAEHSFDFSRAPLFGLDCGNDLLWRLWHPKTLEELFDESVQNAVELCLTDEMLGKTHAMAVDSLSSLPSGAEVDAKLDEPSYGTVKARRLSTAFRVWSSRIYDANLAVIFVDQVRAQIGQRTYGPPGYDASCGQALKFYTATRVLLKPGKIIKNAHGVAIGLWVDFDVTKNKVASPRRRGAIRLLYDYGIDDLGSNLQFLKEPEAICGEKKDRGAKAQARFYEVGGRKFRSLSEATHFVESESLEKSVQQLVVTKWLEMHAVEPRKVKVR